MLAAGASIVADSRASNGLGYSCSAGIAHNKIIAKLGCGLHKPNQQTVVPLVSTASLLAPLDIGRLRGLGAKLGDKLKRELQCETVGELAAIPKSKLVAVVGTSVAEHVDLLRHGEDREEVKDRSLPKSIGCGKTFRNAHWGSPSKHEGEELPSDDSSAKGWVLKDLASVETWMRNLATECADRLAKDREQHQRVARLLTISLSACGDICISRTVKLRYGKDAIFEDAMAVIRRWAQSQRSFAISSLYLAGGDFVEVGGMNICKFMVSNDRNESSQIATADATLDSPQNIAERSAKRFAIARCDGAETGKSSRHTFDTADTITEASLANDDFTSPHFLVFQCTLRTSAYETK